MLRRDSLVVGAGLIAAMLTVAAGCREVPVHEFETTPPGSSSAHDPVSKLYPNHWFLRQRMVGDQPIPVNVRSRALRELERAAGVDDAPGSWQNVGPTNIGGRVTALAVDPNDPDRFWVGTADGGVWLTADFAQTWTPLFDDQATLSIGAVAAHPTDSDTVYVGTGEDNGGGFSYPGEGVFKTTDGGVTWTDLGLGAVRRIGRIAVDPLDPERVFLAAGGGVFVKDNNRGIYRSTNGGASWQQVLFVADDSGAIDVAIDPSDPNRIYAAIWQRHSFGGGWYIGGTNSGIWRSTDGGDNWTRLTGGLPTDATVGRIGLAIAPSNPQVVYALIIDDDGNLHGVYRTLNGGGSWSRRDGPVVRLFFGGFGYYFGNVRVDPNDSDTIWLLDVNLLKSTNGGQSVTIATAGMHVDFHALEIGPGTRQYAGNDGGVYVSTNNGGNWTHADNMPITQFYDIGIAALDESRRFAGAQDNGTNRTTTGGDGDWEPVLGGDGMECEVDPSDSLKVYAEAQFGNIHRSVDGGASFVPAQSGIDQTERANWVTPIVVDQNTPSTLYTGFQRVYRSIDSAVNWTAISPLLDDPVDEQTTGGAEADPTTDLGDRRGTGRNHTESLIRGTITAVAVSPLDDRILWAGTDDGNVWVTANGGLSWNQVDPPGLELWVTDLQGDPFDAQTAYLSVTGYRQGDRLPYLRKTTDLGVTWIDISGGLPQVPVNTIAVDPQERGQLFVGTDVGTYVTDDGGASWQAMSGNFPIVVTLDLELMNASRTLYAATHGRSIYTFDLGQLPGVDPDGDGVPNLEDCAPNDGGAFNPPGEVELTVGRGAGGSAELSWTDLSGQAGPDVVYDVATDTLSRLRADAGTANSGALACALTVTSTSDPAIPASGDGTYYMVRGSNVCALGPWGSDGAGTPRSSAACP